MRAWRVIAGTALVLAAASMLFSVLLFGRDSRESARVKHESAETRHALCALRGDLEQRIDSSTAFLQKHPEGIPGVEPKLIRDGIENQRRTVRALHELSCG